MMTNAPFVAHAGMMERRSAGSAQLVRLGHAATFSRRRSVRGLRPSSSRRGAGARRLAQSWWLVAMACDPSRIAFTARPPAAIFWRRDRSSGRGEHGDFSRLVPSRPATRWAAAHSSGGRRPLASRTTWVRATPRRTPRQARRRCTCAASPNPHRPVSQPAICPAQRRLAKRPSRTGRRGL